MPILNEMHYDSCNFKNKIYVRIWKPDTEPVGIVQICHGLGEHICRYDDLANFLASNGYIVIGHDHLGHGKTINDSSEYGYVGDVEGWDLMLMDMRKLFEKTREEYPDLPHFIFGHSMGSFMSRAYIIRFHDGPDGVILSGTGEMGPVATAAGKGISRLIMKVKGADYRSEFLRKLGFGAYNKRIEDCKSDYDWLSRDSEVVKAYNEDPLCGGTSTAGLFYALIKGMKEIGSDLNYMRVNKDLPIYIYSGEADPVGDYGKAVRQTCDRYLKAGVKDVEFKLYPDMRHECHNELGRETVYNEILIWLEKKRAMIGAK